MKQNKTTHYLRRYLLAGLLVWLPIWITLLVIRFVVELLDGTLSLLPKAYQPETLLGFYLPGLGVVLSIVIVFMTGMVVTNYLGRRLIIFGESIVAHIPLVRSVYNSVKQVVETLFSSNGESFKKVLLIEYPRVGLWSIAFQTGVANKILDDEAGEELVTAFIPTTPNPTSGFLVLIPRTSVKELDISIDQALKLIISLGVVQPTANNKIKFLENPLGELT